jgi:hypothetical protein
MLGELLFFVIYICQQLGVMLGVGAQTLLLWTHLVALHRHEPERLEGSFYRAAQAALGIALALIVVSGAAAILMHLFGGEFAVLFAPAFLFKWVLVILVAAGFWYQKHLHEWSNTLAVVVGGSWYAIFLVHSSAPVIDWISLLVLYVGWMILFGAAWGVFVWVSGYVKKTPVAIPNQKSSGLLSRPSPQRPAGQTFAQKQPPTPVPEKVLPPPVPAVVFKPVPPPPPPPPAPLPVIVPKILPPPPPPSKPVPPPKPVMPIVKAAQDIAHKLEETWLPALRIMPQTEGEIGKYERGPVINLDAEI